MNKGTESKRERRKRKKEWLSYLPSISLWRSNFRKVSIDVGSTKMVEIVMVVDMVEVKVAGI